MFACSGGNSEKQQQIENKRSLAGYQIHQPTEVYELAKDLKEISGLASVNDTYLLANEDETGHLYLFNLQNGKVEEKWKWGKEGDYEGVALVNGIAYVLESGGDIHKIVNYKDKPEVEKIKTALDSNCDAEGLCLGQDGKSLLVACKEGSLGVRKIHSFNLADGKLGSSPFLEINFTEIEEHLAASGIDKFSIGLQKFLSPKSESGVLFPSGIAIHPQTGDLYVLSARSKLLVVYSPDKALKDVVELTSKFFAQPEAICFSSNGDLFIGNEAKGGKANILKFEYDQQ